MNPGEIAQPVVVVDTWVERSLVVYDVVPKCFVTSMKADNESMFSEVHDV